VIGAIAVTQAFVPLLGSYTSLKGPPGRIVNISWIGGKVGFPSWQDMPAPSSRSKEYQKACGKRGAPMNCIPERKPKRD
jgi:NAD(P)-dependent dehydrogenase (short-subunit alcohol dehydrogenase family)